MADLSLEQRIDKMECQLIIGDDWLERHWNDADANPSWSWLDALIQEKIEHVVKLLGDIVSEELDRIERVAQARQKQ
jgi:hypothetical protein